MRFVKNVQNFVHRHELWQKDNKVIVGVSGGPDSACLLHVLSILAKKYNFSLQIAHVNYGLRGKDSDLDEAFVKKLGEKYGLPVNTIHFGKQKNPSEEQMREFRYAFFEKLRKKYNFDLIAVAHNLDDQVETIVMRIIRGAGLSGLSGMRAKNGFVIRPFLEVGRREIMDYLKQENLKYRTDKSNKDTKYFRNKIRNLLIPYLEKNFNPNIKRTIFQWSKSVADDYAYLETCQKGKNICKKDKRKSVSFSVQKMLSLHVSDRKNLIRAGIRDIFGNTKGLSAAHLDEVCKIIKSGKNKHQKAAFIGLNITRKGDTLQITANR